MIWPTIMPFKINKIVSVLFRRKEFLYENEWKGLIVSNLTFENLILTSVYLDHGSCFYPTMPLTCKHIFLCAHGASILSNWNVFPSKPPDSI